MARLPRIVIPGQPQLIIQRGNNHQDVFAIDADYQIFRDALVEAADTHGLKIHAHAWMTNHIHLLGTPEHAASVSKVFLSVGRRYVQYFNYTYRQLARNAQDRSAAYRALFKTAINKADLAAICDCTRKGLGAGCWAQINSRLRLTRRRSDR